MTDETHMDDSHGSGGARHGAEPAAGRSRWQGQGDGHTQEVIKHAKEGVAHTKEAIHHIEESIKGTGDAHAKEALQHAKEAITHADESIAHAEMEAKEHEGKKTSKSRSLSLVLPVFFASATDCEARLERFVTVVDRVRGLGFRQVSLEVIRV